MQKTAMTAEELEALHFADGLPWKEIAAMAHCATYYASDMVWARRYSRARDAGKSAEESVAYARGESQL